MSQSALSRMVRTYKHEPVEKPGFVAVSVAPKAESGRARGYTVCGPRGLRVEGLSVEDVAVLFARLSCSA